MTATWADPIVPWADSFTSWTGAQLGRVPVPKIEIAPGYLPTDANPVWVDITDYVRGFATSRGRQIELDDIQAGTARILLSNGDQRFDPNNTNGPYYGELVPMVRCRITLRWDAVSYPLFSGLVAAWPQRYPDGSDAIVQLEVVEAFQAWRLAGLNATYSSQLSGARIAAVLDDVDWPAGATWRDLDNGQSTVQAATVEATAALGHLYDVARSESGLLFISRAGAATFIDRRALLLTPLDEELTWGPDEGEHPVVDIQPVDTQRTLWNGITVAAPSLTSQVAEDTTARGRFFPRSLATVQTLLTTTNELSDLASVMLARYKDPATRFSPLVTSGMPNTDSWPAILGRELGDKIRARHTPTAGEDVIEQDSVIEGISCIHDGDGCGFTFSLSPMSGNGDYWILNDPVQSILGSTTRLAY